MSPIEQQKQRYRHLLYSKLDHYVKNVTEKNIIVNEDINLCVQRFKKDLENTDYYLNYQAIDVFFDFLFFIYIDNNHNQFIQFTPEDWQVFYFVNIYGFYWANEKDKRRFNRSFLTISKKNGKTTLAVIQILYHLTKENINAKTYSVSESKVMSEDSALFIAKNIINNSPALFKRIEQLQYSLRYTKGKSTNTYKMLPFKPAAMNGIKPSFAIVDELHLMPDSQIVDKLTSGQMTGSIPNPLLSIVGTRGNNSTYYQFELEQVYKKVLRNEIKDESTFIMMFGQDNESECNNPEFWIKSNPNIYSSLDINLLKDNYEKSKLTPSSLREFFSFNLNLWVDAATDDQFIEDEFINKAFDKGNDLNLSLDFFRGKDVYLGLDTSKIEDLSSLVILNYDKETKEFFSYPFIYFAKNNSKKIRNKGVDLTKWLLSGEIKQSPFKRIDYTEILEDIIYLNSICNIKNLGHDGYNKSEIIPYLDNQRIYNEIVSQSIKDITTATKLLDKIFATEKITCVNGAYKWQFKNAIIYEDINNNKKLHKKKSLDSIDSIAALINALELWRRDNEDELFKVDFQPISIKM
jgi:phage terminase large subunit-like protein